MASIIQIQNLIDLISSYTPTAVTMVLLLITPLLIGGVYIFAVTKRSASPQQYVSNSTLSLPIEAVQRNKVLRETFRFVVTLYSLSLIVMMYVVAYSVKNISTDRAHEINSFVSATSYKYGDLNFMVPKTINQDKYNKYLSYMNDGHLSNIEFLLLKAEFDQAMSLYIQNDQPEPIQSVHTLLINTQNTDHIIRL